MRDMEIKILSCRTRKKEKIEKLTKYVFILDTATRTVRLLN